MNGNGAGPSNDDTVGEGDEEANENLQYAWEALEMAATIFRRLGDSHEEYLAEAHCGLGEILMENQNCADALKDYSKSSKYNNNNSFVSSLINSHLFNIGRYCI